MVRGNTLTESPKTKVTFTIVTACIYPALMDRICYRFVPA
jgi:hypothetical protein